jgi:hypothetical protein
MEVYDFSEIKKSIYQAIWRHIPKHSLQYHSLEKLIYLTRNCALYKSQGNGRKVIERE